MKKLESSRKLCLNLIAETYARWGFQHILCSLVVVATGFGCARFGNQGSSVQQVSSASTEFTWDVYRMQAIPDQTASATATDWSSASGKIKFFVNKRASNSQSFPTKIQAQHPTREFLNVNGGFITFENQASSAIDPKTGKPYDGNLRSRRGEIQGVVIVGADGVTRELWPYCFEKNVLHNSCKTSSGDRYLKPVYLKGDDYVYETSRGTLIATAKRKFVATDDLSTLQDGNVESGFLVVEIAPNVEIWGAKFSAAAGSYENLPICSGVNATAEGGVFVATPPASADAVTKAGCFLQGKSLNLRVRCLSYANSETALPGHFCTKAETYDLIPESNTRFENGGYGIWLAVREKGESAQSPASEVSAMPSSATETSANVGANGSGISSAQTANSAATGICATTYKEQASFLKPIDQQKCAARSEKSEQANDAYITAYAQSRGLNQKERDACFKLYCDAAKK